MPETISITAPVPTTRTRVIPLPSSNTPLSCCLDHVAGQLDEYRIDTASLRQVARRLDRITDQVGEAQGRQDAPAIVSLLESATTTMREAGVILKMLLVLERGRLPEDLIDHLSRVLRFNDQTLLETNTLLERIAPSSS
jgi:hypothetical protein